MRPSVVTVIGLGQDAIPERLSAHEKEIVTGVVVLIPFAPGVGETVAVIVGGVLSSLTVAHPAEDVFPAESVAAPQKD